MMKDVIIGEIRKFVADYQLDRAISTRWGEPLVGFGDAADPLFAELKKVVIETHALPQDLLPGAATVIAFFLPFPPAVAATNITARLSSPEWALSYIETNALIGHLGEHMIGFLGKTGAATVGIPATHNWIEEKLISNWSHRHVAFIAGLGRFGQNNMLITGKGCSGRIGSLITTAKIVPDERPATEACLFKYDGSCRKCVRKCVNEALQEETFDRFRCYAQLLENVEEHKNIGYADVCGKCLAAVPCTHTNPVEQKRSAKRAT
jgi:epoxyqueuosine reductase QueG